MSTNLTCPKCSRIHPLSADICDCGYVLRQQGRSTCPSCSRPQTPDAGICSSCGHILTDSEPGGSELLGIIQRNPWKVIIGAFLIGIPLRLVGMIEPSTTANVLRLIADAIFVGAVVAAIVGYVLRSRAQ